MPKGLSCKCDDPRLSKRIKIKFFGALLATFFLAYATWYFAYDIGSIVVVIAKEVLK